MPRNKTEKIILRRIGRIAFDSISCWIFTTHIKTSNLSCPSGELGCFTASQQQNAHDLPCVNYLHYIWETRIKENLFIGNFTRGHLQITGQGRHETYKSHSISLHIIITDTIQIYDDLLL